MLCPFLCLIRVSVTQQLEPCPQSVMSLQEENRVLQGELARLEDLLAHSRADRDELAIKYGAISERVRRDMGQTTATAAADEDVKQAEKEH